MVDKELLHLVSFEVAREFYGLPITRVQEIIRLTPIVKVPQSPDFVEGVINLRGKIIPIIDLKKRFLVSAESDLSKARIIIAEIGKIRVGFIVDAVYEVINTEESNFAEAPSIVSSSSRRFVQGIIKHRDTMIMILNVNLLLTDNEAELLSMIN